jgi:hypothetical protein
VWLYCLCVIVYCHRVTTQLQLINIIIIIIIILWRMMYKKYTHKIIHTIIRTRTHPSLYVLKFTLPACRPKFTEVSFIAYKFNQASSGMSVNCRPSGVLQCQLFLCHSSAAITNYTRSGRCQFGIGFRILQNVWNLLRPSVGVRGRRFGTSKGHCLQRTIKLGPKPRRRPSLGSPSRGRRTRHSAARLTRGQRLVITL